MKLKAEEIITIDRFYWIRLVYKKLEEQSRTTIWINPKTIQSLLVDNDTFTVVINSSQVIEIEKVKIKFASISILEELFVKPNSFMNY